MPDTLETIRDGAKGTPAYGLTASDITTTTLVEVLPPPTAGYHYEIRQVQIVNKTASETPIIIIEDEAGTPVELLYVRMGGLADPSSMYNSGWLRQPIRATSGKAINAKATTATGDCRVMIWADLVAD